MIRYAKKKENIIKYQQKELKKIVSQDQMYFVRHISKHTKYIYYKCAWRQKPSLNCQQKPKIILGKSLKLFGKSRNSKNKMT